MPVDDYYSLIGVSADADREEIKDAYRSRRAALGDDEAGRADSAKLNRAWNVLSDQAQRDRYDDQLAEAKANDEVVVPEIVSASTNGSGSKTRAQQRREQAAERQANRPTRAPIPIVTEINGVELASNGNRLKALGIDAVLFLLLVVLGPGLQSVLPGFAFRAASKSAKPEVVHNIDKLSDDLSAAQAQIDKQIKVRDQARSELDAATKKHDADKAASAQADVTAAAKAKKTAESDYDKITNKINDANKELSSIYWFVTAVFGVVLMLVFAVPSALTGRSPGKALRKLRLVRASDGGPISWRESLKHYGIVIGFFIVAGTLLGPPAWVVVLFGVTSFIRNPKRQGWHDRYAHTVVAEG